MVYMLLVYMLFLVVPQYGNGVVLQQLKDEQRYTTFYLFGVIVQVRVVFRKTVVGDWRFDYLSGTHLQSEESSSDDGVYASGLALDWSVSTIAQIVETSKRRDVSH